MFRKVACLDKQDALNYLLVCVDDFSSYFMVEAVRNKQAKSIFNAFTKIVRREKALPTIVYCDKGSEFDKMKLGFRVQFTVDKRKAVYTERAIRMIRRGLEQYYASELNARPSEYVNAIRKIVTSHNNAPSDRSPKLKEGLHASPHDVIHGTMPLVSKIEKNTQKKTIEPIR